MNVRAAKLTFLLCGMLFLLSGCLSGSVEDLYALPQLPADRLALQQKIDEVMGTLGAEYAAPSAGNNVQTLQLQDLDGDGVQESAIAFFRVPNEAKPLKIYIFRQNGESEAYETAWVIEGEGTAIYSVTYDNLGGGEEKELVVSWQISSKVHSLAAYSLPEGEAPVELMRSGYTNASITDLDRDNEKEVILVQLDTAENNSRAEMYDYSEGIMVLTSTAPLSLDITDIVSAKPGYLVDSVPALFVSSDFREFGDRISDILAVRDGMLTNITLDPATGVSTGTIRYYKDFKDVNSLDINSDSIQELPIPEPMPLFDELSSSQFYLFRWYQYSLDGEAHLACTTFHNYDDSWYLVVPESWVGQITVARQDTTGSSASNTRAVTFYHWTGDEAEPEAFLTIYRLTDSNRTYQATTDGRFSLFDTGDEVYAGQFHECSWDCGLDEDSLRANFYRIRLDWATDS